MTKITASVGRAGINRPADVRLVQQLLNNNLGKLTPLSPLVVDGRIGPATFDAIEEFQRRVVGMALPDGRVDPSGRTLALLNEGAPAPAAGGAFRVAFQHHAKTPEFSPKTKGIDAMYESTVIVSGGGSGSFRGSIYPDDMVHHGRIKDGVYDLYLGFHKREGHKPSELSDDDLEVRTNHLRAVLVVNADHSVPVLSDSTTKTTGSSIHVHNGYRSYRGSEGCLTLHPNDWSGFLQIFLDAYPSIDDWVTDKGFLGKKIGILEVRA